MRNDFQFVVVLTRKKSGSPRDYKKCTGQTREARGKLGGWGKGGGEGEGERKRKEENEDRALFIGWLWEGGSALLVPRGG